MVSFNLVFHVASALACVLLIFALLRLQSLVRFHGQLWRSLDPSKKAVQLDWPAVFLEKFAGALQIPVEGLTEKGLAQKIRLETWVTAHFELGFERITWAPTKSLVLTIRNQDATGQWAEKLEQALGGGIHVELTLAEHDVTRRT